MVRREKLEKGVAKVDSEKQSRSVSYPALAASEPPQGSDWSLNI